MRYVCHIAQSKIIKTENFTIGSTPFGPCIRVQFHDWIKSHNYCSVAIGNILYGPCIRFQFHGPCIRIQFHDLVKYKRLYVQASYITQASISLVATM